MTTVPQPSWKLRAGALPLQEHIIDKLIGWHMASPRFATRSNKVRGLKMQKQWTIEARADFADQAKNDAITQAIREAAVHVHAVMALLSDGQKPQVVCYADDFFEGHQDISLHEDTLGKAIAEHSGVQGTEVSAELMQAAKDLA